MEAFTTLDGIAAPLLRDNIDTDLIIRIERLTGTPREALGSFVFESLRRRADGSTLPGFVLDDPGFAEASILVSGANFGCGSSREGAVWALRGAGLRCVIAASFGDIFYNNCFQNGLLPIRLPPDELAALAAQVQPGPTRLRIDLHARQIIPPDGRPIGFAIEAPRREALLHGLDDIALTQRLEPAIAAFQQRDRIARPWVYSPPPINFP